MNDARNFPDTSASSLDTKTVDAKEERRDLLILRRATRLFGVFADESDTVVQALNPTPLPHAPQGVRGVVSVRGRMLTVLDPLALLRDENSIVLASEAAASLTSSLNFVVALGGDEQLALMADKIERVIEILVEQIEPPGESNHCAKALRGIFKDKDETIAVLNVQEIFAVAMHGAERRRQRSSN